MLNLNKISTQKKWQLYYFFMAFTSAMIILVFLQVNLRSTKKFHEINLQSEKILDILINIDQLSQLLTRENAPGNNVFQSKSYFSEKEEYEIAHSILLKHLKTIEPGLSNLTIKNEILKELLVFERHHAKMDEDIQKLFENYRQNKLIAASENMAHMDQAAAKLNQSLLRLRHMISTFQSVQLKLHDEYLKSNSKNVMLLSIVTLIGLIIALYSAFKTLILVKKHETKEKLYLKELELVSERLQSILNQAPIVVYECLKNKNWTMNFLSTHIFEISGYEANAFINDSELSFASIIHEEDRSYVEDSVQKSISSEEPFNIEYRIVDIHGKVRWVWERGALSVKTGNLVGIILEITDKKTAEASLKSKSLELAQVMKAISESAIVTSTDAQGRILEVNDLFISISGYSREELIGKNHRIINSGVHSKTFFKSMWKTISSGKVWNGEIENKAKDGRHYFVRTVISPVGVDLSKPERYIAIRFDITEQVLSERKLEEAQRVAKLGSWSFDVQSQRIEWSKQMYKLFPENYNDGPPSFDRHFSTIHREDQELWKKTVENCLKGTAYKMRFRSQFPDKTLWIEAHGYPVIDGDKVIGLYGTCQDVTELVLKDMSLQQERTKVIQTAKLASLGEMSAGVAHEINNPLMVILGATHQAFRLIEDNNELTNKLNLISKSATRIVKIVEGLRKFSRSSERDKLEVKKVYNVLTDIMPIALTQSKRSNVQLDLVCDEELMILCNEIEIQQVIINLINNAIDAASEMSDRWVNVKCFNDMEEVAIQVMDSGTGIPLEIESRLFEPFFTTKEVGKGTGLGLSISKGIIEEHEGKIFINRSLKNTCFEIRFQKAK
jgi:PAS domain S-box-containing protein